MIKNIFNLIFLMILFVGLNANAQQLSYQGRIVDTATNLGISGPVTFRVQVRTPPTAGDNCVMYEEQINANLFNGVYVITLNSPAAVRLDGTGYTAAQIFSNKNTFGAFNLPAGNCNLAAPLNWSPGANDGRRVNISFYDANTMAPGTWEPVPTQTLGYVPAAIESLNVGGFAIEQLMRVVGPGGSPFNVSPLNNTQYTELINTLSGNSSFYLDAADPAVGFTGALAGDVTGNQGTTFVARIRNVPVSATAPIAGQVLSLQGGSWTPTTMVSNVTSANNFISIANTSSTPVITLNVGTVANTVAAGDDPRIVNAIGSGATASGDLTGTYPGPTVATVGGRTAAQINTSVGDTIAATSANTNSTIVKRDGSGNASFTTAQATNFSGRNFYFYDAGANSVQIRATNALANSYVLTLPTTVPVANTVLGTNASGDMSWVNPLAGAVTTVTASAPVVSSGGSTPNISMARATGAADGYLASTDFTTFNNKQTNTLTSGMAWIGSVGNTATAQFLNISNIKSTVGVPGAANWFAGAACPAGQQLAYSAVTDQVTCTVYTLTAAQVTTALATVLSGDATMNASGDLTIRNGAINNAKISDVMWSKVTSTPTTIAGYGITDAILTEAGGVDTMQAGTFAAMPAFNAPGVPFRFYIATDTREVYYSDGFQWRLVGSAVGSGGTVTNVIGTSPLTVVSGTTIPVISISQANGTTDGYLTSTDWTTFNAKLTPTLTTGNILVGVGNVATSVVPSGDISSVAGGVFTLANSGVVSGTYTKITVDSKGRAVAGTTLNSADVTTGLGYSPVNRIGDTMTGALNLPSNGLTVGTNQLVVANGGRVTIGSASGDASALLDITSTSLGFLMPRMTTLQRDNISNPANGLQVFNIQTNTIDYFDGTWKTLASTTGSLVSLNGLGTQNQFFATSTSGNDFTITSASATHTFNIPTASSANRGLLNSSDFTTFNNKLTSVLTTGNIFVGVGNVATSVVPSGDVSAVTGGVFTFANTGVTSGTYGSSSAVPSFSVDSKGRITAAGSQPYDDATAVTKGIVQAGTGLGVASGTLSVLYGNTATTAAAGNDARLSDARTPTGSATGDLTGTYPAPTIANNAITTVKINDLAITNAKINDVNWGKVTSTPTTIAGYGITDAILTNAGGVNTMQANTLANIPPFNDPGVPFRVYVAHDTQEVYYSDGTQWKLVGSAIGSGGTVTNVIGTGPLSVVSGTTVPVISISRSNATTDGYLASTDFSAFSGKVSSVSVDPPLTLDLTSALNPVIGIGQASTLTDGFLTSGDYSIFNNKLTSVLPTGQIFVGVGNVASAVPVSGDIASATGGVFTLANSGVVSGTYTKITVDSKGRAIAGTSLNSADVTGALGYSPVDRAGDTMIGTLNLPANGLTVGTTQLAVSNGGRVTIGSASGDASALLDVTSTTLGFLMPRMTTLQRDNISNPADGLQIYNIQTNSIDYWDGGSWLSVASTSGSLSNLNGLTASSQDFTTGSAGTDFNIVSASATHTFNIPNASGANNRGLLTSSDWTTFNNKLGNTLTTDQFWVGVAGIPTAVAPSGDVSSISGGVFVLANTGVVSGTYGAANAVPTFSVDAKGRVTAAGSQAYQDATGVTKGIVQAGTGLDVVSGTLSVLYGNTATTAAAGNDARLSDARVPTGSATGDLTGTYPAPTIANLAVTNAKIFDVNWNKVTSTPTTIAGYGITDAVLTNAGGVNTMQANTLANIPPFNDPGVPFRVYVAHDTQEVYYSDGTQWKLVGSAIGSGGTVTNVIGTGPLSVVSGTTVPVISISRSNATTDGYLASTDFSAFSGKVSSVSVDPPLTLDLTSALNPVIGIGQASTLTDGFLTSGDYSIFNNKLTSVLPTGQIFVGVGNVASAVPVSGDIASATGGVFTLANSGVVSGTYTKITVDSKGRAIAGTSLNSTDVTNGLGYFPVDRTGDTMTGTLNLPANGLTVGTTQLAVSNGGRVTIGSASGDASALLDIASTTLGFLMPRMTAIQRDNIVAPANGLQIYNTQSDTIEYWDGAQWLTLASTVGSIGNLNGLTAPTQNFATGTAGTDFTINSVSATHTFNIPTASAANNRGLLTSSDFTTFNEKLTSVLTTGNIFVGVGNVATSVVPSGDISSVTGGVFTLANTGVAAGNYSSVTVDSKGRVTAGAVSQDLSFVTGTLGVANGGTGANTLTSGSLVVGNGTGAVNFLTAGTAGNVIYGSGASSWASGTPDTAGLVDKSTTQLISGDKSFKTNVTINEGKAVRFADAATDNFVSIRSPAVVSSDYTLTLPSNGGNANQVLQTDGNGTLNWTDILTTTLTTGNIYVGVGNVATSVTPSGDISSITGGVFTLANTGVASGTYTKVSVDAKGRVTTGANLDSSDISSAIGYDPVQSIGFDAPLSVDSFDPKNPVISIGQASGLADGFLTSTDYTFFTNKLTSVLPTGEIFVGVGNVATAVPVSGDIASAANGVFVLANSGVNAGTYSSVTVDAKGRVTSGAVSQDLSFVTGTLGVANGGTGANTLTSGSLVVGNGTGAVNFLTAGTAGNVIYGSGASSWASGTPDTAGLVDKSTTQLISGDKSFKTSVTINEGKAVRFADAATDNYVSIRSPAVVSSDYTLTLPSNGGNANQVLQTDGSGTLNWADILTTTLTTGNIYVGVGNVATSVTPSGDISSITGGVFTLANTGVASGTYTKVSVDAKGRVTTGANLNSSDISSAIGYDPVQSIGFDAPISVDSFDPKNPVISIGQASGLADGFLTSTDYTFFTNKLTSVLPTGEIFVGVGNVATAVPVSGDIASAAGGVFVLANSGVSAGTYSSVTVDSKGRVTSGAVSQDLSFVTGTLGVANGGTGANTLTSGSLVVGNGTGAVNFLTAGTAGNVIYGSGASSWASGTPDTAGLVDKSTTQLISGDKSFKTSVTINEGKAVRFADAATDNYISIRSPTVVSSDYTLTLPSNGGNANQVLQTDGSGTLNWADILTTTLTTGNIYVGVGNVATSVTPSGDISSVTGGVFTLANTGVVSGTYTKVSVDAKGRVTTGSSLISTDVTTALGYVPVQTIDYGAPLSVDSSDPRNPLITIGQATLTTDGFLTSSDYTTFTNKLTNVLPTGEIFVGVGNVATAVPVSGDIASAAGGVFVGSPGTELEFAL